MKEQIVILVNPLANKHRAEFITGSISSILSGRNIPYKIFIAAWPPDINIYKEIWLVGGDGTLNYFLNHYTSITIPVVVFKGGTGNDFATKLYGNSGPAEQAFKALDAETKNVDAADCNGRIFINGVGVGFDGEVLRSMNSIRLLGGHLGYLWIVIRKIFSFKEKQYRINFDGKMIAGRFLLVMITNSTQTGGGFKVSPAAKIDDGKLNMVLCKPLSVIKRLKNLPVIEKGKHLQKDFIIHEETATVTIECEEETLAQIDGELISAKDFAIKILPGRFLFKY
jgi:YegS/Rv2252/BmrU family lipid kinase